jgi:hypothetical protein
VALTDVINELLLTQKKRSQEMRENVGRKKWSEADFLKGATQPVSPISRFWRAPVSKSPVNPRFGERRPVSRVFPVFRKSRTARRGAKLSQQQQQQQQQQRKQRKFCQT